MDCLLQARGVGHRFHQQHTLYDFNLCLAPGEIVGLLGINGAGKSTALAVLAGCLPPTRGSVQIGGRELYAPDPSSRAQIGILTQKSAVYPDLTVRENLTLAARLHGLPRRRIARAIECQYAQLELGPFRQRLGLQLSSGMARRTALAMALIHDPRVLLLDEPTAGLDPAQAGRLRRFLGTFATGRAILLSSHLLPDIEQTCGRAILLHEGRAVAEETIDTDQMLALARFSRPPGDAQLLEIEGIEAVLPVHPGQGKGVRLLRLDGAQQRAWPELLSHRGWGLRSFALHHNLLFEHFARLNSEDAG